MEVSEMIKVMQHFADGGEVEFKRKNSNNTVWSSTLIPTWSWDNLVYRIKEEKQKVTIEKWLMQSTRDEEYRIIETSLVDTVVNFKKVKLIESYEVELWNF